MWKYNKSANKNVTCSLSNIVAYAPECDKDTSAEEQWPDDEDA